MLPVDRDAGRHVLRGHWPTSWQRRAAMRLRRRSRGAAAVRRISATRRPSTTSCVNWLTGPRSKPNAPTVVCAFGGYGRRTLCLHSDLDVLIVFEGAIGAAEERLVKEVLQPLWDLQLTVGHHVRELVDFDQMDASNPEFLMALCDLRLLTGDVRLFDEVLERAHRGEASRVAIMLDALIPLIEERHRSFNDTLYQLEPDVKKAPGGLRDIAAIRLMRSLARETFATRARPEAERLEEAEEFLFRVRSILHTENGRDMNVLTHELQERVADMIGVAGQDSRQRVETLMGEYFRHARGVVQALAWTRNVVRPPVSAVPAGPINDHLALGADGVRFADPVRAVGQPLVWLEAFEVAIAQGQPVSEEVRACIQENVGRYTADYFMATREARARLRAMLVPREGLSARLGEMLECGLLGAIFPEFERIHGRVIRDFYHKYTVDEHTLLTIRNLESLWHPSSASRARFSSILNEVRAPELLTLALLYHDVGKWRDDDHSTESVRLAGPMLARLQLGEEDRNAVEFLIRQHLAMSKVVFRRDFGDPDTVAEFAALVGSEELLKMLCLMTLVDIEAVAPGTLTPWKEDLLWRLYVDAYNHLTLGYADELIQKDQADRARVLSECPDDLTEEEVSRFLDGLPRRYLSVFGVAAIYRHRPAGARPAPRRGAPVTREARRHLGADRRGPRQALPVLEHRRGAGLLRHGHSPGPGHDHPRSPCPGRLRILGRRRVPAAEPGRPRRDEPCAEERDCRRQ
jgi:[protein-PII] uridylyltransferase